MLRLSATKVVLLEPMKRAMGNVFKAAFRSTPTAKFTEVTSNIAANKLTRTVKYKNRQADEKQMTKRVSFPHNRDHLFSQVFDTN